MLTAFGVAFIVIGLALIFLRPRFNYLWGGKWRSYITGPILIILGILMLAGVFE
jgi:hypothetical protein